jgi:alpha-N-arabinofuranosidase
MKNTEKPFPHLPVLKKALVLGLVVSLSSIPARGQQNKALADADQATTRISKHIYGHFAEHLGRCIYDGFYVGENHAKIPNTNGVRNDIIQALRELHIPNLRWPGGCFADTYHWKEGIGPKSERKAIENLWWGNYREDNSFGTHEFLDMCELLGAEPYLAVNMNTGSVQEASEWVQYVNHANGASHLTDLRAKNGRATPWKVKYWGIGNESWDCGGGMTVEHYSNLYRQFATAMTSWSNSEQLFRIAVGPGSPDYAWTETLMQNMPARRFEGLSVHHYSVIDWGAMGPSTGFSEEQYFKTMQRAWFMEEFVSKNSAIMDKYDPTKRVALIVDEWGGWYNTDPEGKGALYQQNTMRDAMIAGITLNIFNNHADRVRMANLAQTVNVLQAVILTKEEKLLLTPTYHVMEMYKVHQEALLVPIQLISKDFEWGGQRLQAVSASASLDSLGKMHVSLVNIDPKNGQSVEIDLKGFAAKQVKGRVLASANIQDHNTFESPNRVMPRPFSQASLSGSRLTVSMPAGSVVVLELIQ